MKVVNGFQVIEMLEQFAPKKYAMDGDPIGLLIGTLNKKVSTVLTALDVLENVVDEAIEKKADLIIAHHPIIFRPLKKIALDEPGGKLIEKLIKHDIAVYAAHTNLDVAKGGVNDMLAEVLRLKNTSVLVPTYEEKIKKLAVFVPIDQADQVLKALGEAGAGFIGEYSHCSFSTKGTGRFLPGNEATPFIGARGKMEEVSEIKVETVYPESIERKVVSAMMKAHPYEEPAYDLYPLSLKGEELGLGRIGELAEEMTLREFADHVKEALDVDGVRVIGNTEDTVKKVAVLGGDGNKYFQHAKRKGADVYVTGDFYYHTGHDAMNIGLNIVDPGHHVEKVMKKGLANILEQRSKELGYNVKFIPSKPDTDPFTFL
ncbi:Nif3-like dinuclear metal center hexameric protein [Bacillus norwichensis]|uniref:GTP cyclohydrolase 1 type 2 homolog n=1 Tax=Bacillus norwichensis TaxID=2762217 RepID=A0ABR8VFS9_9BACI|nr:Nif3-like dinuclear metal center hexameric protein [Bacillus norwichensis]MBD8003590.1 Nif3-like dinuclear metal center hexameric protein [Bacillus norwichensis]